MNSTTSVAGITACGLLAAGLAVQADSRLDDILAKNHDAIFGQTEHGQIASIDIDLATGELIATATVGRVACNVAPARLRIARELLPDGRPGSSGPTAGAQD